MSFWAIATVAAANAVSAPMIAIVIGSQLADASSTGFIRTMRKTPAVTMVAAWIRADTGVGPAMASGSQTDSGSWADLPTAPMNSRPAMAVAVVVARVWAWALMAVYWIVPSALNARNMASR